MHGVTGRMGMNQHLIRSICAIRAQGGTTLANGDKVMPDPILIGRNAEKIEALAKAHGIARWGTDLAAALANKDDSVFFDAGTTQMRPTAARRGDPRRQARLLREADRHQPQRGGRDRAHRQGLGPEARRGPGQALPARPAQARHAAPRRLLRPHAGGAHRLRLLGVRGRSAADPAAVVELPRRRRRRHDPRHDVPLALRARQPVRRSEVGVLPRRDPHPEALGRSRQALRRHRRRRRLRDLRARRPQRRAGDRAADDVVGDSGAARRPGHLRRRRHRRLGGRRPFRPAGPSRGWRRRGRCGTRTRSRP